MAWVRSFKGKGGKRKSGKKKKSLGYLTGSYGKVWFKEKKYIYIKYIYVFLFY